MNFYLTVTNTLSNYSLETLVNTASNFMKLGVSKGNVIVTLYADFDLALI